MTFQVSVNPSGRQFSCEAGETVLAAAMRAGVQLPYGCKNGACGSCKGKLVSGSVELGPHQARALSTEEQAAGQTLFCCAVPHSDVSIEAREVLGVGDFPVKKSPVRVARLERAADDVMLMSLQLPATERLQYKAGQYVEFLLKDGKRRAYSIATPPHADDLLSLHIRHMPGGVFTDHVFGAMKEKDILRFEGPLGTFFLREDSNKPIVLLASGTGFAPIKAILSPRLIVADVFFKITFSPKALEICSKNKINLPGSVPKLNLKLTFAFSSMTSSMISILSKAFTRD